MSTFGQILDNISRVYLFFLHYIYAFIVEEWQGKMPMQNVSHRSFVQSLLEAIKTCNSQSESKTTV